MAVRKIDPAKTVTPDQLELLALIASGYDYGQIAAIKFLSYWTVRNKVLAARDRAEARSITHLCVMLVDRGLIQENGQGYKPVQEERVIG